MLLQPSILVASDLSESSGNALKAAEKLRRITKGKIHVIHSTPYPEQWDWLTNDVVVNYYPENFKKDLIEGLEKELAAQLKKYDVEGSVEILIGPAVQTILDFSSQTSVDLLILGHKEKGSFLHLSGVAAKVMAASTVPVLIANQDLNIERVAGLVDPYRPDKKVFSVTEELGFLCSGDMEFISVFPDDANIVEETFPDAYSVVRLTEEKKKEIKEKYESVLKNRADSHTNARIRVEAYDDGDVQKLVEILDEDRVGLAVMKKHHKGKLEKFFLGSVTKGVLNKWKGSLLILPS